MGFSPPTWTEVAPKFNAVAVRDTWEIFSCTCDSSRVRTCESSRVRLWERLDENSVKEGLKASQLALMRPYFQLSPAKRFPELSFGPLLPNDGNGDRLHLETWEISYWEIFWRGEAYSALEFYYALFKNGGNKVYYLIWAFKNNIFVFIKPLTQEILEKPISDI